jgi:hypothetical protein
MLASIAVPVVALAIAGCGGGSAGTTSSATSVADSPTNAIASGTSGSSSSASAGGASSTSSGSGSSSSSASSSTSSSSSGATAATSSEGSGAASRLAIKLGKPARLLVGLGAQGSSDTSSAIRLLALQPDIYEQYLGGVGAGDWTTWNSPAGYIVQIVAQTASADGAVPMYTLYAMASNGDGNLSDLSDTTFMAGYWANVRLLFQQIALSGKPALVNMEPDFWGYAEQQSGNGEPSGIFAYVNNNADCATLTNDVTGIAGCMIAMARKYAPKAYIGFPPSTWGATTLAAVVSFMNKVGAQNADFLVVQTSDRDAGCYEAQASYCAGNPAGQYWDETNTTHPNFQDFFARVSTYQTGIGHLPVIFWQTPEGVPSSTPGGTPSYYRDNRVHYFLTHPSELTAVGGVAVVFSTGEKHQTNVTTDGGQFQQLDAAYLAAPVALP